MAETRYFGYFLVALSAGLLAQHWQQWRDARRRAAKRGDHSFLRLQIQRRSVASALIGVVGAAMTIVDRVPRTPQALSAYLFALVLGGLVVLGIALSDLKATRRRREDMQLDLLADELRKAGAGGKGAEALRPVSANARESAR
jgi:hypothetical protein